jgi:hypothetical protein
MEFRRNPVVMEEVTDANEIANARGQRDSFGRNAAWLQNPIAEVHSRHRGKCICVAGENLFAAGTPKEATAMARAAHLQDRGWFTRYIPRYKAAMIYAVWRRVAHPQTGSDRLQASRRLGALSAADDLLPKLLGARVESQRHEK